MRRHPIVPVRRHPGRLVCLTLLASWPAVAHAEAEWLVGFQAGGQYRDGSGTPEVDFRVGLGADCLFASGLTLLGRLETTHLLEATAHLGFGWSGAGLLDNQGLPLGLAIGPTASLDRRADTWAGGRATLRWSLWFSRALLELDVGASRRLAPGPRADDDDLELRLGLGLRLVPF